MGEHSTRGQSVQSRDGRKSGKRGWKFSATGFVGARLASRQKGNFRLCEPKIRNWYKDSKFESLYWTLASLQNICRRVEPKLNTVNMTAWVHKECDIMNMDVLIRLQGAWENPEQKDECIVRMNDLERDYWMGTEVGQLGGYEFQGATIGVVGSCM